MTTPNLFDKRKMLHMAQEVEMREFKVKQMVRVVGFKVATPCRDQHCEISQREHIQRYADKTGEVVAIDKDPYHPITVRFSNLGNCKLSKVCRFSPDELN